MLKIIEISSNDTMQKMFVYNDVCDLQQQIIKHYKKILKKQIETMIINLMHIDDYQNEIPNLCVYDKIDLFDVLQNKRELYEFVIMNNQTLIDILKIDNIKFDTMLFALKQHFTKFMLHDVTCEKFINCKNDLLNK